MKIQGHIIIRRKPKNGDNGQDAVLYELMPSGQIINFSNDNVFSPSFVTCSIKKIQGSNLIMLTTASALSTEGLRLSYAMDDGSDGDTVINPTTKVYPNDKISYINFILKKNEVIIDKKTIQICNDGKDGEKGEDGFQGALRSVRETEEKDVGKVLGLAADVFNRDAPSSLGTILSFFMKGMAAALNGKETFDLVELADAMRAGTDSIMNKAGSKPGEKTILDAMVPAVKVLEDHSKDAPKVAFEAAMRAAAAGFEETRAMKAVWGRAAYYGEKSVGLLDGGAAVGKLIFEAINESCGLTACN